MKPNVVFVTTHDSGRYFNCYGVSSVHSPNINALAEEGVLLENCFCTSPVCTPSRASMMTGLYPQSHGMIGLLQAPWCWKQKDGVRHLAQILKHEGYHTQLIGLQHEFAGEEQATGFCEGLSSEDFSANELADQFDEFLQKREHHEQPFYAQIGFFETHTPFCRYQSVHDDRLGVNVPKYVEDGDAVREYLAQLQGSVREVDQAIGKLHESLKRLRLEENTIVVFATDHGIEMPRAKWTCYDAGIEVAVIVSWADGGVYGGRRIQPLISSMDLMPTLLELLEIEIPKEIEGESFADLLRGESELSNRDAVYGLFEDKEQRYVRTDEFKLIRNFKIHRSFTVPVDFEDAGRGPFVPFVELYHVKNDPLEQYNLALDSEYQGVLHRMDGLLWSWMEQMQDPLLFGPTVTPYYQEAISSYRKYQPSMNNNDKDRALIKNDI
ncbi:MAG: sulfatase [Verrucomicrobiota bacterium]